jgi:hypothetical protein
MLRDELMILKFRAASALPKRPVFKAKAMYQGFRE